jgi:hypothetical protein
MSFIHEDFLLGNKPARRLYHKFAEAEPIFDYHCHISPKDIAENRQFKNLFEIWLEKLTAPVPTAQYHHNRTGEDNADAHLKRQIMGREVVVAITRGKLDFGPCGNKFSTTNSIATAASACS